MTNETSARQEQGSPLTEQQSREYLSQQEKEDAVKAAHRNDLRRILGYLFTIYGVIVTVIGLTQHAADIAKTGGIAINLWLGIAMLAVGIGFLLWNRLRPLNDQDIIASAEESAAKAAIEEEPGAARVTNR